ncbi:MAG: hypothetical protein E6I94_06770, partial [Chloroflexi bacterium]
MWGDRRRAAPDDRCRGHPHPRARCPDRASTRRPLRRHRPRRRRQAEPGRRPLPRRPGAGGLGRHRRPGPLAGDRRIRGRPAGELDVDIVREPSLCTRFVARGVRGVTARPAPDRVQMRLLAAGMRPVSNVVDASNTVMLELGKPTHAFDAAAVHEGRIIVRLAKQGERLVTLDHVDRELDPEALVIADPAGILAIAGIIGGEASEVSDATRDVVIESAIFDPVSIRRTGHRYGLRSEASLRFEKGQEFRLARIGADRVARLIADWSGGSVAPGAVDTAPTEP